MEACVQSNLNALLCKQPCVVTRPSMDDMLWLWVQHMEKKSEIVNGRMLLAKQESFEESLKVPEDKRLPGPRWLQLFCQA